MAPDQLSYSQTALSTENELASCYRCGRELGWMGRSMSSSSLMSSTRTEGVSILGTIRSGRVLIFGSGILLSLPLSAVSETLHLQYQSTQDLEWYDPGLFNISAFLSPELHSSLISRYSLHRTNHYSRRCSRYRTRSSGYG